MLVSDPRLQILKLSQKHLSPLGCSKVSTEPLLGSAGLEMFLISHKRQALRHREELEQPPTTGTTTPASVNLVPLLASIKFLAVSEVPAPKVPRGNASLAICAEAESSSLPTVCKTQIVNFSLEFKQEESSRAPELLKMGLLPPAPHTPYQKTFTSCADSPTSLSCSGG